MSDKLILQRVRPETTGIAPTSLLRLLSAIKRIGFTCNSMMIIKDEKIAFEIYYKPFT